MIRAKIAKALSSIVVMVGLSLPSVVQAETPAPGWTARPMSADGSEIRTDGTLVYAHARGTNYQTNKVNGVDFVTFADEGDFKNKQSNVSFSPSLQYWDAGFGDEGLSSNFGTLLKNGFKTYNDYENTSFTLNGLTEGKRYLVQLIMHKNGTSATATIGGATAQCGGTGWTYGGSLEGVFVAGATSETFALTCGGGMFVLNAIQVRELSGGDDPDPTTYAVSWTGGANAGVVAKVDGVAISSGANVEDGKSVVFTVTPDTDYEFASASDGWTLSSGNLTKTFTVSGEALLVTIPNATEKTTPPPGPTEGWTAVKMTTDSSSIRKDGVLVYAYAYGDYTANGVEFKKAVATDATEKTITNDDLTWVLTGGLLFQKSFGFADVEDAGYKNLMGHSWGCQNTDPHTIELKGLTPGSTYLVQIVGCQYGGDNDGKVWVQETADQTFGTDTPYIYVGDTHGGDDWTYGGSLIGVFTAESSTKSITLKYASGSWAGFNAIQVRDLSGGDDPEPATYAVTWSGAANASVVAKVDGAAISSGADVEDGKSVVFTVTPNTGYEFAEASYQDWDKSGGDLTRTVTVNGEAVSITIPNATKKDIPVVVYGWKAEQLGTSETAIYTVGTKKYAYCSSQFGNLTVNTVPFDQKSDLPSGMSISVSNGEFFRSIDAITLPSGVASDSDYGKLLTSGYWGPNLSGNNDIVITFNGLVEGKDYLVQLISHSTLSGRNGQITVGGKTIDPAWDFGGSLVGVFKAEGSSQAFTFTFSDKSFINGFQVRELAEGEGAGIIDGGDDPEPATYAVTWTGGENADVDVKANGSVISSGALVGDGTNVVFTVTPNTDYEFAESSYQDWTLDNGVLTRTVTVNGAAVSVTIPNATAKVTPPDPELGWSVAPMSASGDTIRTDGTLVYAVSAGESAKSDVGEITVNTVPFVTIYQLDDTDYTVPFSVSPGMGQNATNYGEGDATTDDYKKMLQSAFYESGLGDRTFTLNGLESGCKYLVQLVYHRKLSDTTYVVTAPDGVTTITNNKDVTDNNGWSFVGVFEASGTSQSFTFNYATTEGSGTKAHFNAIQVRKLSGVPPDPPPVTSEWEGVPMTSSPDSIRTDGVLKYAYAWKDCIVNGVVFTGAETTAGFDNDNLTWTMADLVLPKTVSFEGIDDAGYSTLMHATASCLSDPHSIVLKNLTPGHDYLVQIIGCNPTGDYDGQVSVVGDTSGEFIRTGGDGWPFGGSLVGVVTAGTDPVEIDLAYSGWACFNAIQVRDLSLTDDDAVAIIDHETSTNYYFTIEDAYRGAVNGETIKLVKDTVFPVNDPVFAKGVDLDLNGHVVTRSNLAYEKVIDSQTVITNGTFAFDSGAYPDDVRTPFNVINGETLTLASVNVGDSAGNEPLCLVSLTNGAHVVISGEGTYHVGSLFKSTDAANTMSIEGGRFIIRGYFFPGMEISLFDNYNKGTLTISGGSFSIVPNHARIAEGCVIMHDVSDPETPYHIVPASEAPYSQPGWIYHYANQAAAEAAYVAKRETADGVKYYTSLADAVRAADGSGTVTLIADIPALDSSVALTGTMTLDGNGHKVSVAHPFVDESGYVARNYSFNLLNVVSVASGADVVLRNISLSGGGVYNDVASFTKVDEKGLPVIDNFGTLVMDNVTVTRSNGAVVNRSGAKLYMDNCRLVRNCRYCAGGLFNVDGAFAVMVRSSLSENRSLSGGGGGGACENGGTLFVNNCVICNNSSTEVGGAINNFSGSNNRPKLYLMNTTLSGNFSSIWQTQNQYDGVMGGGVGIQRGTGGAEVIAVNSLFSCNYQTRTDAGTSYPRIRESDICSVDGETPIALYYTVYTGLLNNPAGGSEVTTTEARQLSEEVSSNDVFNAYYASSRIYQNANPTAMEITGAQLVSKDDGSLDASLARYAPIKRVDNGDGTYTYGRAVYGTDGVYTYFDASDWKNRVVAMSYAPVEGTPDFFDYDHAGTMTQVGSLPMADEAYMVTNYYESSWGRSFGVAGASGWLKEDVTYYTVKLAREPENGTCSGISLFGDSYEEGTKITLTATPGYAREFLGWYEVDAEGNETLISGSATTVWELTVDKDYVLVPKFSDLQEVLTPDPYVHVKMADDTEGPLLYPITVMTKWMRDHYEDFEETLAGKTKAEAEAWLTQILEQTSPGTGRKMWQDYVLGIDPSDVNGRIWINSPQYMSTGKDLIRMEMNKLSPVSGSKFTINYRLDKKLGDATAFSRADVNGTGSYDVKVENDPSGLYVIDLLFIPEGKSTSEEYVTTVNTAGLLRVSNTAKRAAVSVPWTKLQPAGSDPVRAVNLVKTTNLTPDDVLYVYDLAKKDYRAWKMDANGNWSPLNVFKIGDDGFVDWDDPAAVEAAGEGSEVARGLGIWLERANTNDYVYLCGQYDGTSVAETLLSKGWNLVGNPSGAAFDLKNVTPAAGDQIIVPTAAEPKTYTYENGAWGYWKKKIIERSGGRKSVQTFRETEDTVVPAGLGFWYISGADGGGTLDWTGAKEEE